MLRILCGLVVGVLFLTPAARGEEGNRKYVLVPLPLATYEAELQWNVSVKDFNAREWIVYAPYPVTYEAQGDVSVEAFPASQISIERSKLGQRVLWSHVNAVLARGARNSVEQRITYKATLARRRLTLRTEESKDLFPTEIADRESQRWLYESDTFNFSSRQVTEWINTHGLTQAKGESEIDFAKRVYSKITHNYEYYYHSQMERTASHLCETDKSDCGGLCILFVSVMRANGIPARLLTGRWAKSERKNERVGDIVYHQQHVKAEFFADGVGWVPVDLSSSILHDNGGFRHFGADGQPFFVFHFDCDLDLDTRWFGVKTLSWLQSPAFWVTGQGSLKRLTETQSWEVEYIRKP